MLRGGSFIGERTRGGVGWHGLGEGMWSALALRALAWRGGDGNVDLGRDLMRAISLDMI